MEEASHLVEEFQPMFEACPEVQRSLQSDSVIFDSAKCDITKRAIIRDAMYEKYLARYAFRVAYETCD